MRHLKTILTLVAILSLSTGKAQFWYPTFFSWDFENSIKVQDSVYLTGFGTFNDTMRLFGTSTSGVGVDYDSLTLVDNGSGLIIHLNNARPILSGSVSLNLTSGNALVTTTFSGALGYVGELDAGAGADVSLRFQEAASNVWAFTHDASDDKFIVANSTTNEWFHIQADGGVVIEDDTDESGIIVGRNTEFATTEDVTIVADTVKFQGLDGAGDVIKLGSNGEATKGKLYYSMGPLPNDAVATGATEYVGVYGSSNFNNTADRFRFYMPHDGEFSDLRIYMRTAQPATGNVVATLYKNGSPTSVTVTIAASDPAGVYSDLVNSVSFVAGDYFYIQFANSASSSSGQFSGISLKTAMDAE